MVYVGIDISKYKHDCFIYKDTGEVIAENLSFENSKKGFQQFLDLLKPYDNSNVHIGLEATGHYDLNLKLFLEKNNYNFMEFNPLLVKEFKKSLTLRRTKTDKVDAIVICQRLMSVPYKPNSKLFYHKYGLKLFTRLRDAYTHGIKDNRGIMGNTYTSHKQGIDMSYVDRLEPITNFAIQGSTRCQMNMGKNFVSTICLNPASMGIERALIEQQKINDKRIKNNQKPLQLVKDFEFEHGKEKVTYHLVDARLMAPSAKTVEPITTQNAKLALRLQFLDKVMKEYDRNNTKDVKVMKKV